MNRFRIDNTEGYTQSQLTELNQRFADRCFKGMNEDEIQNLEEQILEEFDTENSNEING